MQRLQWGSPMTIRQHTVAPDLDEAAQHYDAVAVYADEGVLEEPSSQLHETPAQEQQMEVLRIFISNPSKLERMQLWVSEGNPGSTPCHLGAKALDTTRLAQLTSGHASVLDWLCHKKVLRTSGQQVLEAVVSGLRSMLPGLEYSTVCIIVVAV
ncbi:TPA: hypothetical protein ACH3X1_004829 [Trebouxia sp. C0004]